MRIGTLRRTRLILASVSFWGILLTAHLLMGQEDRPVRFGTGEEIPVGVGTLLSGRKLALGREILDGAEAYLKDHPFIREHPVVLVPVDDRCDKTATVQGAESFCAMDPRPVAVVGYLCSPGTMAALPVHERCRLPLLNVSSGEPGLTHTGSPWIVRMWTSRARQGRLVCQYIRSKRIRRVLLVHEGDATSQIIAQDFLDYLPNVSSRTKAQVLALEGLQEPPPELLKGKVPPQLIYYVGEGKDLGALWEKLPSRVLRRPWILDQRAARAISESAPPNLPGALYSVSLELPTGDPKSPQFAYFRGRFGEPGVYTLVAYDALAVLWDALERSGHPSSDGTEWYPSELMKALRETHLQGLTGAISFDEWGDRISLRGEVSRWKDGHWEAHWHGQTP